MLLNQTRRVFSCVSHCAFVHWDTNPGKAFIQEIEADGDCANPISSSERGVKEMTKGLMEVDGGRGGCCTQVKGKILIFGVMNCLPGDRLREENVSLFCQRRKQ